MTSQVVFSPIQAHWRTYRNYVWCLHNEQHECLLIDPGEAEPVLSFLEQHDLLPKAILITHHHLDHINGVQAVLDHYGPLSIYGPHNSPFTLINHPLHEGDLLNFSDFNLSFTVMETPGHTFSHISLYNINAVFSGDALFSAGCGIVLDDGSISDLFNSAQRIAQLPETTQMYCPHEYTLDNLVFASQLEPDNLDVLRRLEKVQQNNEKGIPNTPSTIALEKQTNPFLRAHVPEVKQRCEAYAGKPLNTPFEVFEVIRSWR